MTEEELTAARRRFDETCDRLRPDLHRFCTRMTGSPCDGEDVLQDALVLAFYRLSELRDPAALRSWLFGIAHNKCIDFLRRRRRIVELDEQHEKTEGRTMDEALDEKRRVERALSNLVTELPPKERACIVLKDVLDCSLEETAEITGSSVGAVKAALFRGREKLERAEATPAIRSALDPRRRALVERYLDSFNRRDWDGVRALLADESRLEVVHASEGPFRGNSYFLNYGKISWKWKLALAHVDGVESIVHFRERDGVWVPHAIVELDLEGERITRVRDYVHVDYLLQHSVVVAIEPL